MTALEVVTQARAIPVLRGKNADSVLEVAHVLLEEGFKFLEVTFTVPNALEVMRELSKVDGAIVGAGTVLEVAQYKAAEQAGAKFVVSPGVDVSVLEFAKDRTVPLIPGVFTPSEVMCARAYGFSMLKLFPGELGGISHLKSLRGPFPDLHFMPTGGVNNTNIQDWANAGAIAVGIGSSLTGDGYLAGIRLRARELRQVLDGVTWQA
jgi:2-dehydro-3-deoxyphosphogluconate aldolase / (4S)-4-hydroxy-2-oxoglutarate aldolase